MENDQMANLLARMFAPLGMLERGNINLENRPVVRNPDGSISTERSISIGDKGQEVLIPTIIDGKAVSPEEAMNYYRATGEHLGKFKDVPSADRVASWIHGRKIQE
jgi:hypothetical protein